MYSNAIELMAALRAKQNYRGSAKGTISAVCAPNFAKFLENVGDPSQFKTLFLCLQRR